MTPPKSRPDDPFNDDDWGTPDSSAQTESNQVAAPTIDPNRLPWIISAFRGTNVKKMGTLEVVSYQGASKFSDVTLVLKFNGKQYHIGLQTFDKSYIALHKHFGDDKTAWHGTVRYKVMEHKGNPDGFVALRP